MKNFFESLNSNTLKTDITPKQKEILRNLTMLKAVTKYKNSYYLNDGYLCGRLDINYNGTGFVNTFLKNSRDIIVENKHLNNASIGDIVLIKVLKSKKSRTKAKIAMVLEPAFATSVVYTKQIGKEILGVNVKTGLAKNLKATQKSLKQLLLGTVLKIDNISGEITEILGNIDDPLVDEKISLGIYNKANEFSTGALNEAGSFGDSVDKNMYPSRADLTELNFCTIDPIDAKDFDDAVYFDSKTNSLYVAIADVSEYVAPYSQTDKEAKFRGFSIYFPHKSIPMLPRSLSENICSLKPNADRLAFCFKLELDDSANVIKYTLFNAIIRSKRRFNYDEIDELLISKNFSNDMLWIPKLYQITTKLKKQRLKKGFDFMTKELRMILDDEGNLHSTRFESSSPSHSLIEECMLLANKAAASMIKSGGIFRNHEKADYKKLNLMLEDISLLGIEVKFRDDIVGMIGEVQTKADDLGVREEVDKLIIKAQKKAGYAHKNKGHYGLGFELYSHFTSPIRRYSDLILHRLLKAKLQNDEKLFNYLLLNIDETCENLNELEKEADKVAYDFMDRKFARWAKENVGRNFTCYISQNDNIVVATLDDRIKGARVYISNFTNDILTKVLVRITDADIASAKIFGSVVKKLDV
ncbi:MAG: ribonuclease R [Campylobacter sp.]|nr:ribonuclease R [Campylobacter sp.]